MLPRSHVRSPSPRQYITYTHTRSRTGGRELDAGGAGVDLIKVTLLLTNWHPKCFGAMPEIFSNCITVDTIRLDDTLNYCRYFLVGCGWWPLFLDGLVDGCCYFLVGSKWLLLFLGGLCIVAFISEWALHGCCYFRLG